MSDKDINVSNKCEDTISRQAAIDALYSVDEYNGRSIEAIRNLPTIDPQLKWERDTAVEQLRQLGYGLGEKVKRGRWMETYTKWVSVDIVCSKCGKDAPRNRYGNVMESNYCPNCGARMVEGGDAK